MQLSQNMIINTNFTLFILIMICFKQSNILNSNLDHMLAILALFISLLLLFFKKIWLLDFAHFLYILYLFIVSFFSNNSYFLGLNILMIGFIIFTHYYYNICILIEKQNNQGYLLDLSNIIIDKYISFWNWDYIFPLLIIISCYKFIKNI